jgi:SAM-dependent methyltransferase
VSTASLIKNVLRRLRDDGLRRTIAYTIQWVPETFYEGYYGVRTRGVIYGESLGFDNSSYNYYAATRYLDFKKAMKYLDIDNERDVFLDYGSGMGRVVIMAATYPFKKVIGVELSLELSEIAKVHLERTKHKRKCQDVQIICEDAVRYKIPSEVTVIFFASPFSGEVLAKVLDNIKISLVENPRKLSIIYINPSYFEELAPSLDWLKKRVEFRFYLRGVIYQSTL